MMKETAQGAKVLRMSREIEDLENYIKMLEEGIEHDKIQVKKARIRLATLKKEVLE